MSKYLTLMLLTVIRFSCSEGLKFTDSTLEDGKSFIVCTGTRLQIRWDVFWPRREFFGHAEFFFTDSASVKRLVFTSKRLVPIPPYISPRIAGYNFDEYHLTLSNLKPEHSGVYSIEINPVFLGDPVERSVNVYVLGVRSLEELKLEVKYEVVAEENTTDQWSLQLRCAGFPFSTPVPLNVEWVLPSGETTPAISSENGSYILPLSAPVMGGKYVCRISKEQLNNLTCASANSTRNTQASLEVNHHILELIQQIVENRENALQKEIDQLKRRIVNSEAREYAQPVSVSFSTRSNGLGIDDVRNHSRDVTLNDGDAYDSITGCFTAPLNGTYFFLADVQSGAEDTPTLLLDMTMA